jgi:hypothetical protein
MDVVSDARNLAWLPVAVPAGASAVIAALVGASNFLSAMQSGWRVGLIVGLGLMLSGLLVVPAALAARKIGAWMDGRWGGGTSANGQLNRELAQGNQRYRYGDELPSFPPVRGNELADVFKAAHEFRQGIRGLIGVTDDAWARLRAENRRAVEQANAPPLWRLLMWRADRIESSERQHFNQIAADFERIVEGREEDPRPYLVGTYTRYRKWREEFKALAKESGYPMAMFDCIKWDAAEQRLAVAFKDKLVTPNLRPVQNLFVEYSCK